MARQLQTGNLFLRPVIQALLFVKKDQVVNAVCFDNQWHFDGFFAALVISFNLFVDGGNKETRIQEQVIKP